MAPGSIIALVRFRCLWPFDLVFPPLVWRRGFLAGWAAAASPAGGLLPPPLLPLLDVRVFTGGASIGLCDGLTFTDESDELPWRPAGAPSSARRDDVDFSEDFFELPPNSRLKKPGLLSPLLDIVASVLNGGRHKLFYFRSRGHIRRLYANQLVLRWSLKTAQQCVLCIHVVVRDWQLTFLAVHI